MLQWHLLRKCLLLIWGISAGTTSEPLWSFSAPVSAVQSHSQALARSAPTSLLASRQVSSVTSLAHPMLCLLGCQLWSLTKKGFFFFFNSCFQFSGDSDTAARIKWSSSPSELYSRRPWVSSLKESLVSPAIKWIQFFNLTDGKRHSSSAVYLLAQGPCFSNRLNDSWSTLYPETLGRGGWEGMNSHAENRRDNSPIRAFFLTKLPLTMNPVKEQKFHAIIRKKVSNIWPFIFSGEG